VIQGTDRSFFGFRMRPAVLQTSRVCAFLLTALVAALVSAGFLTAPAHGQVSVLTQNYDNGRSGSNNHETILTPGLLTASPTTFGKLFTLTLDNNVYGMPLILGGLNVPGEPTNILLVKSGPTGAGEGPATSLWAFNTDTGTELWHVSLGTSPGHTTASPVIDPTVGTDGAIYVMSYVNSLSQLHAIDPIKGTELAGSPVTIAASAGGVSFNNSSQQNSRPALLLFNGVIYAAFSHSTDSGTYHGWVIGYKYTAGSGFTLSGAFCDTPAGNEGGIWQGGGGLIADSSSIYAITGNGSFSANTGGDNYSMSALRLSPPALTVADWFAPSDEATLSNGDADLDGGGMTLIPGTTDIFLGPTKFGGMLLVNTTNLGKFQASGPIQRFSGFGAAVGFNPISWDSGSGTYAYVWPSGNAISQFSYDTSTGQFSPAGAFKTSSFSGGGTLTISSNNGSNGILWATGGSELHAMNPANVSAPDYWNSNMNAADAMGTGGGKYQFTTVANGKVYVTTTSSTIVVYGTTAPPPPPPNPPTNLAATAISSSQINLSWTASTTSGATYSIFRSTTSGFAPSSGNQIASGVSGTTFSDTGLAASTTYYYLAEAVDSGGTSAASNQASATTQAGSTQFIAINAGGPAEGSFVADEDFTGGAKIDHANTINTSKVTNPAPAAVYQSARIGAATASGVGSPFTYTITGLTAGSSHTVRLHFAETFFTTKGSRVFNVSINGTQVLTKFDIVAASGGENIANIQQFTVPANASGQYVITFTSVTNNALISGIEID
jgi:Malectin domain/PQQ-like domain